MKRLIVFTSLLFACAGTSVGQNETKKWYFSYNAALDFSTDPPTILSNNSMTTSEGCASIADQQGNLLFYTNGENVWNSTHSFMANGTGLLGNESTTQGALIVKKPSSTNIYYIFTADQVAFANGLRYSIVDMSLAAGLGSVTTKNVLIYTPTSEKMTGVVHCNGVDFWIVTHKPYTNEFVSILLTSAGLSSPSTSSAGITANYIFGQMKISPNGKKLACITSSTTVDLFDFDNTSGMVSNHQTLSNNILWPYGVEFSADGSKLYATGVQDGSLIQFDVCAGIGTAISTSQKTIVTLGIGYIHGLQLAINGKIYVSHPDPMFLGVINNPKIYGLGCNYIDNGQSLAPKQSGLCSPNFVTSSFRELTPFSYTSTCQQVSFSNVVPTNTVFNNCAAATYSMSGCSWNFGDPGSGGSNVSSLANPSHTFSAPGSYTVRLVRQFACTSDTIRQVIAISPGPSFSITGPSSFCPGESPVLSSSNNGYKFLWSTGAKTSSVTVTPAGTSAYHLTATDTVSGCSLTHSFVLVLKSCVGVSEYDNTDAVKIFPNPGNGIYNISLEQDSKITVYNQQGLIYFSSDISAGNSKLDLSQLSDGILFIESINAKGRSVRKLVKQSN
jgi:PKD repeat protein